MPFKLHPSVWISPFNFRSGFELEKCITLLKGKNEPTRLIAFKSPLKVEVEALNVDAFQFRMRKDVGRNLVVEAVGILERKLDGTQISGEVRFSRQTIFILFLILAIQAPIFIPMFGPGIIALDLLMVSIFTVVMISGCNGLTYQLNTLLEAIPESDQQSLIVDFPKHYSYRQSTKNLLLEIAGLLLAEDNKSAWYVNPDNGHLQPTTVVTPYGNLPQIAEGVELSLSACESCLQASDLATGNLLWQIGSRNSPALVSNAVVNNHTVYIMEQHAQLLLLDLHTGQKVGAIQFELPKNQDSVHNGPGQISGSYLSIQKNILAISFHDTNVLSVYSISG